MAGRHVGVAFTKGPMKKKVSCDEDALVCVIIITPFKKTPCQLNVPLFLYRAHHDKKILDTLVDWTRSDLTRLLRCINESPGSGFAKTLTEKNACSEKSTETGSTGAKHALRVGVFPQACRTRRRVSFRKMSTRSWFPKRRT